MLKWVILALFVGFVGYPVYGAYDFYRAGLHTRPEVPEGAFSISYANGLRAIITGVGEEDKDRRYPLFRVSDIPQHLLDIAQHMV